MLSILKTSGLDLIIFPQKLVKITHSVKPIHDQSVWSHSSKCSMKGLLPGDTAAVREGHAPSRENNEVLSRLRKNVASS